MLDLGRRLWLFVLFLATSGTACRFSPQPPGPDQVNWLAGRVPIPSEGVQRGERISDGTLAPIGETWSSDLAAILPSAQAFITIDLGEPRAIGAALLQGDHNDHYFLSGSLDGHEFTLLWDAPAIRASGLRVRQTAALTGHARYLRLAAGDGDGAYSVTELQVFGRAPPVWAEPPGAHALGESSPLARWILLFGISCALFLLVGCQGSAARATVAAILPIAGAGMLLEQLGSAREVLDRDVSLLRATVAAVAVVAVVWPWLRLRLRSRLWRGAVDGRRVTGMLAVLAVAAVACFFNLGRAQFWDAKENRPSYVHNNDMRVYFPVAKYFRELRYDGLYLASIAAYLDNAPGQSIQALADVELRDLRTHRMVRVRDVAGKIYAVRQRFSPERWTEFRRDMQYFHETMGPAYFSTLADHGGNATPVWLTVAHVIFARAHASNATLLATGLLDPLLLLVFAVVIGRTFGARTAFVCLIVFGANDFYMFGTSWAGSTLRNDWMIAIGLGVAALKRQRWMPGGALLAYAGLVRAFPALALIGLAIPPLWWAVDHRRKEKSWPSLAAFARTHEGPLRALAGAAICVVALVVLSCAVLSPAAWILWARKAAALSIGDHVNHLSLRSLAAADLQTWETVGVWAQSGIRVLFFCVAVVVFVALTLRALRGRPPEHAALIALLLIPVVFHPANYYFHFVFLLPLLASSEGTRSRDVRIWALLLAMCAGEFPAALADTLAGHFVAESCVLLVTFFALVTLLARETRAGTAIEAQS
jgi:ABC-type proline/glycine betaine transport system permease subunit